MRLGLALLTFILHSAMAGQFEWDCPEIFSPNEEQAIRVGKQIRLNDDEARSLYHDPESKETFLALVGARQLVQNAPPALWAALGKALKDPNYSPQKGQAADLFSLRLKLVDDVFAEMNITGSLDVRLVLAESLLKYPLIEGKKTLTQQSVEDGVDNFLKTQKISGLDFSAFIRSLAADFGKIAHQAQSNVMRHKGENVAPKARLHKKFANTLNSGDKSLAQQFASSPDLAKILKGLAQRLFHTWGEQLSSKVAHGEPIESFILEKVKTVYADDGEHLNDHTQKFLTRILVHAFAGSRESEAPVRTETITKAFKQHLIDSMGRLHWGYQQSQKAESTEANTPQAGSQSPTDSTSVELKTTEATYRPVHKRRKQKKKSNIPKNKSKKSLKQPDVTVERLPEFDRDFAKVDASLVKGIQKKLDHFIAAGGKVSQLKSLAGYGDVPIGELKMGGGSKIRIYYGLIGTNKYVLLGLGTREGDQSADIEKARKRFTEYKQ